MVSLIAFLVRGILLICGSLQFSLRGISLSVAERGLFTPAIRSPGAGGRPPLIGRADIRRAADIGGAADIRVVADIEGAAHNHVVRGARRQSPMARHSHGGCGAHRSNHTSEDKRPRQAPSWSATPRIALSVGIHLISLL
jgi:hypothetical protein